MLSRGVLGEAGAPSDALHLQMEFCVPRCLLPVHCPICEPPWVKWRGNRWSVLFTARCRFSAYSGFRNCQAVASQYDTPRHTSSAQRGRNPRLHARAMFVSFDGLIQVADHVGAGRVEHRSANVVAQVVRPATEASLIMRED